MPIYFFRQRNKRNETVAKKQLEEKDTIIYNLILMLNDQFDTMDIDNQDFIDYICEESGLPEDEYIRIMADLL